MRLDITSLSVMVLSITTLSKTAQNIMIRLVTISYVMLSIIRVSVVMPRVVAPFCDGFLLSLHHPKKLYFNFSLVKRKLAGDNPTVASAKFSALI
jgi:hypothetical protein